MCHKLYERIKNVIALLDEENIFTFKSILVVYGKWIGISIYLIYNNAENIST